MLPPQLPTSFEGQFGFIRYTASVIIDDKVFAVPFTVIKLIDLNADPTLRVSFIIRLINFWFIKQINRLVFCLQQPVVATKNHAFITCCWRSDPLKIVARTPVGGYAPGQMINLVLNVNNKSDQTVSEFTVQFFKVSSFQFD